MNAASPSSPLSAPDFPGEGDREAVEGASPPERSPSPTLRVVPLPCNRRGGKGFRALARLPFLILALAGLWLIGQGAAIPAKAWLAQILLERAFERSLAAGAPARPWPWADTGPIARVRVPRLGVSEIVLSGGSGQAMAFGPTLLPNSGTLGARGTAVFAAHRDTHFAFLARLRPGDLILVDDLAGRTHAFRAGRGRVVRYDAFGVDRHAARPSIALATCWPIGGSGRGPWRYVVRAETVRGNPEPV